MWNRIITSHEDGGPIMSYPIFTKEPSVSHPDNSKELNTFIRSYVPAAKRKKINHQKEAILDKEEGLRAAKGISYAVIFCNPFWILVILLFVWII